MIQFGVIGYGYWGPNIVRNLRNLESASVVAVCDKSSRALQRVKQAYPDIHVTSDVSELLDSPDIDAIAVITPVWTHFELAKRALENGKHVFVEKPFTSNSHQAEELIELAERNHLKIMVDHTFLFTGAVRKIRQLIDDSTLGKLYYWPLPTRRQRALGPCASRSIDCRLSDRRASRGDYCHRCCPPEWTDRCCVYDSVLSKQCDCAYQCELAVSGESSYDPHWRRKEDGGLERSGSGREDQGLRPRGEYDWTRGSVRSAGQLSLRGHVGAED